MTLRIGEKPAMIQISACLIVKNEEKLLSRCLDCLKKFVDEIIIVDTGSTDKTKAIASQYTDKVYDFTWIDDFAAARNESFSKATKDYIYVADADEVIDEENIDKLLRLKSSILPEIDIIQMFYTNQLQHNTTYNFDKEYRPKLYKRIRNFRWVDPIHESVALEPIIYDSDIEIIHLPEGNHGERDFAIFRKLISKGGTLSKKLTSMYARELFIVGNNQDFIDAKDYFVSLLENILPLDELKIVQCVLVKCARYLNDMPLFLQHSLKNIATNKPSAEVCFEIGEYYFDLQDYKEAILWYYNAVYEAESELNIHYGGDFPLSRLVKCYEIMGDIQTAKEYEEALNDWVNSTK